MLGAESAGRVGRQDTLVVVMPMAMAAVFVPNAWMAIDTGDSLENHCSTRCRHLMKGLPIMV